MYEIVKPELPPTSRFQFVELYNAISACKSYMKMYHYEKMEIMDDYGYKIIICNNEPF